MLHFAHLYRITRTNYGPITWTHIINFYNYNILFVDRSIILLITELTILVLIISNTDQLNASMQYISMPYNDKSYVKPTKKAIVSVKRAPVMMTRDIYICKIH